MRNSSVGSVVCHRILQQLLPLSSRTGGICTHTHTPHSHSTRWSRWPALGQRLIAPCLGQNLVIEVRRTVARQEDAPHEHLAVLRHGRQRVACLRKELHSDTRSKRRGRRAHAPRFETRQACEVRQRSSAPTHHGAAAAATHTARKSSIVPLNRRPWTGGPSAAGDASPWSRSRG
jgi:hypothetical protein